MKRAHLILFAACLGSVGCSPQAPADEVQTMNFIETRVKLPTGARSLASYKRYYYRAGDEVIGLYVSDDKPGRGWASRHEEMPGILDGECSVVNVRLNTTSKKIDAFCNGGA